MQGLFDAAARCFERAGDDTRAQVNSRSLLRARVLVCSSAPPHLRASHWRCPPAHTMPAAVLPLPRPAEPGAAAAGVKPRRGARRLVPGRLHPAGPGGQRAGRAAPAARRALWGQQGARRRRGPALRASCCDTIGPLAYGGPTQQNAPAIAAQSQKAASQQGAGAASLTLEGERRLWVQLAARALQQAGERELAVRLLMSVGGYKQARQLLASMGDTRRLADCCRAAAQQLRAQGRDALVAPWLAEAVRCYRVQVGVGWLQAAWRLMCLAACLASVPAASSHRLAALSRTRPALQGQYMRCFELLQEEEGVRKVKSAAVCVQHADISASTLRSNSSVRVCARPQLLARKSPQALQEIGVNAMREIAAAAGTAGSFLNKSRQARLVAAARLIPSDDVRCNRLEHFGCWAALATEVKVRAGLGQTSGRQQARQHGALSPGSPPACNVRRPPIDLPAHPLPFRRTRYVLPSCSPSMPATPPPSPGCCRPPTPASACPAQRCACFTGW